MNRLLDTRRRIQAAIDTLESGGVILIPAEDVADAFALIADGALQSDDAEAPMCNYCHTRHWGYQDHDMS